MPQLESELNIRLPEGADAEQAAEQLSKAAAYAGKFPGASFAGHDESRDQRFVQALKLVAEKPTAMIREEVIEKLFFSDKPVMGKRVKSLGLKDLLPALNLYRQSLVEVGATAWRAANHELLAVAVVDGGLASDNQRCELSRGFIELAMAARLLLKDAPKAPRPSPEYD